MKDWIKEYKEVTEFTKGSKPEFGGFWDARMESGQFEVCHKTKSYRKNITRKRGDSPIMEDGEVDWGHPSIWEM